MKRLLTLLFLGSLVYACGGEAESTSSRSSDTSSSSSASAAEPSEEDRIAALAAQGEKVYKQYCVACHGIYGDMGASGAFNLTTSELNLEERVQVITKGRIGETGAAMQAFEALLDPEQIEAVARYTITLSENASGG